MTCVLGRDPVLSLCLAAALVVFPARPVLPQDFDLGRAAINDTTVFAPFVVAGTARLRDALDDHTVDEDTPVLVFDTRAGPLALITSQMTYHHVAQGEIAGEPWMVSF